MGNKLPILRLCSFPFDSAQDRPCLFVLIRGYIWEIQAGEGSVVLFCRLVVGFGGVELVIEAAEVVGFVLESYGRGPFSGSFAPMDAFVFRG